jgi:hypothetical protein
VISSGTGTKSAPSLNFWFAYADSSLRKSAVQIVWMMASTIPIKPNVSKSELNVVIRKRAISQCSSTPSAKNAGTMPTNVSSGSTPCDASWKQMYAARNANAKWARLMMRRSPQLRLSPSPINP